MTLFACVMKKIHRGFTFFPDTVYIITQNNVSWGCHHDSYCETSPNSSYECVTRPESHLGLRSRLDTKTT